MTKQPGRPIKPYNTKRITVPTELLPQIGQLVAAYERNGNQTKETVIKRELKVLNGHNPLQHVGQYALATFIITHLAGRDTESIVNVINDEMIMNPIADSLEVDAVKEILK